MSAHTPGLPERARKVCLLCGVAASLVYVGTDLFAAAVYPGFSFTDQAVSELFAIGAPTSRLIVPLFSLSSALLLGFAAGIAASSEENRALRLMALMFAGSALVALVLWNFPMHMRGAERTFTDTMHLILASNPFVWVTLVIGDQRWPQARGRPIAASEAQIEAVKKGRKAGLSLRAVAAATGLGLATVRTVLKGTKRAKDQRRREFDKLRAARYRARQKTRDRLPAQIAEVQKTGAALIKAAKGLGR